MRHLFEKTRPGTRLALLLLPAWLASGCEDQSIRLGGWVSSPAERTPGPTAPAAAAPVSPPPAVGGAGLPESTPERGRWMPVNVFNILQQRCIECHTYGLRDPAGWGSVLDITRMIDSQIVVPGDPDGSRLWYRVAVRGDMPFNGQRLTPDEKSTLRSWIEGLRQLSPQPRTQAQILDLLVRDQAAAGNRSDTRYVSFADFVDARRPSEEIRAAAGVFKVILNSVSRSASIANPVAIDPEGSIWRFRLADLGWSEQDWNRLVSFYPYCLPSGADRHRGLYQRLGTETPIVRGDWFLSTVLTPPLYHDLLQLGGSLDEIARVNLGVDIDANIARSNVQRIAQRQRPGEGDHVLERHETAGGGYLWLTHYVVPGHDVRRTPLGPRNRNDDFGRSFVSRGTDALWSLPNGLQAYLVADSDGNRIDTASPAVALDPRRKGHVDSGTACIGCHGTTGLVPTWDATDIAAYLEQRSADFGPLERERILRIYPASAQQTLAADRGHYRETIRGLLGQGLPDGSLVEWYDYATLRGQYESKLGLRQGALELGADLTTIRREVQLSPSSRSPLPESLTDPLVSRAEWVCHFRRIAREVRGVGLCAGSFTDVQLSSFCDRLDAEVRR